MFVVRIDRRPRDLHPDVSTDSTGEMVAVNAAWAILSDPASRARYDACIVVDDEHADSFDAVNWDLQTTRRTASSPVLPSTCCPRPRGHLVAGRLFVRVHPFMVCIRSAPRYEAVETPVPAMDTDVP